VTTASFPPEAIGPTRYGPGVRALLTYLVVAQHLPIERATEVFKECFGITVSSGFATSLIGEAGENLGEFVATARAALRESPVLHLDETGARVAGRLDWVHSASTGSLTSYLFHRRRGRAAIDEFAVLAGYRGVAVHDGWTPYRKYEGVTHPLCNAHHLRELRAAAEEGQTWANELATLLVDVHDKVEAARAAGRSSQPPRTRNSLTRRYDALVLAGVRANPPPNRTGQPGRPSRTKAANLPERLTRYRDDLRFATDFSVPFSNQAERDQRMVKLQQKISGCYRTEAGATNYLAIRSYVSTARKQGVNVLDALRSLFEGQPFMTGVAGA
jgi:hypothetical protein